MLIDDSMDSSTSDRQIVGLTASAAGEADAGQNWDMWRGQLVDGYLPGLGLPNLGTGVERTGHARVHCHVEVLGLGLGGGSWRY